MTGPAKPSCRLRRPSVALLACLLLAGLSAAGCGGSSGEESTGRSTPAASAACKVGASALPLAPEAPNWWKTGPGPALALACSDDPVGRGDAIVGYAMAGGGACVSAYAPRLGGSYDELCEEPGTPWTIQCTGRGCVHSFWHEPGATLLDGPVVAAARKVRVLVAGRPLRQGVMLARVRGRLPRAIHAGEPFGFFAVHLPRCVEPDEVEVEILGAGGSKLGLADEWDVVVEPCEPSDATEAG